MSATMPVRVMVQDMWDQVTLDLPPTTPIVEAKRRALKLTRAPDDASVYQVKYKGAEILDEAATLADAGVVANGSLIVMPRRRRPIR